MESREQGLGLFRLKMMVEVITQSCQDDDNNGDIELVPDIGEYFHVIAKLDAHPSQQVAPDQRADESEDAEFGKVRFQNSGWKRYKRTHDWQHSAYKKYTVAIFVHPPIRSFEILLLKKKPASILL